MRSLPLVVALLAAAPVTARVPAPPALVWCYRTLADVVCYPHPDPQHPDRLMGVAPCAPTGGFGRPACGIGPPRDGSATPPAAKRRDTDRD